ncbi:hypothetical protein CDAR_555431 [Caerostris darwini]|uniref:Uncharacterized protein n=1 Tax=Caerostris darwini TaxID=1538125 RepID=A0AAV4QFC7_9ARAC|nr:hypothetical protein CDAR_555431 [Caerostris darwini]
MGLGKQTGSSVLKRRTVTYVSPQCIGCGEVDLMKQNMLRSRDVDAARGCQLLALINNINTFVCNDVGLEQHKIG